MPFDAYYEWFGIPPEEQPPDHYRLLGIRRFEPNANVIDNAAERQILLLKTLQNGPHSRLTQRMMNEVSVARICLLDPGRRAKYDETLRSSSIAPPLVDASQYALNPLIDEEFPDHDDTTAGHNRQITKTPSHASESRLLGIHKGRHSGPRTRPAISQLHVWWMAAIAGVAIVCLIGVAVFMAARHGGVTRSPNEDGRQNHRSGNGIAARTPESQPGTSADLQGPVSVPSPPPAPAAVPQSKGLAMRNGEPTANPQPPPASGQAAVAEGSDSNSASTDQAMDKRRGDGMAASEPNGDSVNQARNDSEGEAVQSPTGQVTPIGLNEMEVADAAGSAGQPKERRQKSGARRNNNREQNINGSNEVGLADFVGSGSTDAGLSLIELDLQRAVAADGPEAVTVSRQFAQLDQKSRVWLEDFSSLQESPRFVVGPPTATQGEVRWPILICEKVADAERAVTAAGDDVADSLVMAHLEFRNGGLFVCFAPTITPTLIEQFSLTQIYIEDQDSQRGIRFLPLQTCPPLEFSIEGNKEATVVELPISEQASLERVALDVLQVRAGDMPLNLEAGSRAKIGQKLGVRLDAEINASVDIELRTNDGVVMVAVQPWYELNGRRQRLEAADVRKDVLRMQAQLTKNEKELSQARYGLAQVPGELSRLQRVVPTTGHEAVALQGRFRQLEATASSLQSKVKRLSEVQPKLADSVKTLERVAALAEKMSKQLVLYHRVVLEGEFADLVLLQATPNR